MPRTPAFPAACAAVLLTVLLPLPVHAQHDVEAYQLVSMSLGWGAVRPAGDTGFDGPTADGGASLHLAAAMEIRQNEWVLIYGRADADVADVRQHLGLAAGVRAMPRRDSALRPYAGAGVGVLVLEPRTDVSHIFTRDYRMRTEGFLGIETSPVPAIYTFVEYRLTGARYMAVAIRADCRPVVRECVTPSERDVLHLGHSLWLGMRIQII